MYKKIIRITITLFTILLFLSMGIYEVKEQSQYSRLKKAAVESSLFRRQPVPDKLICRLRGQPDPGGLLAVYWLETNFTEEAWTKPAEVENFLACRQKWEKSPEWAKFLSDCRAVWNDLKYFPIPESSDHKTAKVSFVDSWMFERNYGGKRGHEGTDIMASENVRGFYPVISMTDGVVTQKGWLEQGGYRIGITAPGGAYFYYAHLDSYAKIEIGDPIRAGDLLGFMGDTGYSKTIGTTGNFPVHLHVGIYLTDTDREISVNPYPALRYLETKKLKCSYERG